MDSHIPDRPISPIPSMSSPTRELQQQFNSDIKNPPIDASVFSEMLGITFNNQVETIIDDISSMIKSDYRKALDGYILCLSRIIKHNIAWTCIERGFSQENEKIPSKYYVKFNQNENKKTNPRTGFIVE